MGPSSSGRLEPDRAIVKDWTKQKPLMVDPNGLRGEIIAWRKRAGHKDNCDSTASCSLSPDFHREKACFLRHNSGLLSSMRFLFMRGRPRFTLFPYTTLSASLV